MAGKVITVFEHARLEVTESGPFTQRHFDAMVRYNQQHENRFFTPEYRRIKFNQHVGVIAVGGLTIEVLPKADGLEDEAKWQKALIQMLKVAHGLPLHEAGHAQLALRRTSVLEYFLRLFVEEVQRLVHQGLVKRYRKQAGVTIALKGRLDLPRHIRHNIVHKERFHVVHQVFDTDHLLHAILKKTLALVEDVTNDPITIGLAKDMKWAFDPVQEQRITAASFDRLRLDRKTKSYSDALMLAKLILLNYAPDVKGGRDHILSLLFDMNKLFELVVLRLLKRAAAERDSVVVLGQNTREFWNGQKIRPDILIEQNDVLQCIIDTKWKLPKDDRPADPDLKQMYVYNRQFGSAESVLLYPGNKAGTPRIEYDEDHTGRKDHGCSVRFIEMFDGEGGIQLEKVRTLLTDLVPPGIDHSAKVS
ncbi:MAG: restriction endonuclease [Flavobacteriales bacterium]|nr:restriction endonuclease [Flavobacteriales bacterium]